MCCIFCLTHVFYYLKLQKVFPNEEHDVGICTICINKLRKLIKMPQIDENWEAGWAPN